MIKGIKLTVLGCSAGVISSTAYAFIAVFPISGLVPETGEVISGKYWISDAMSNPERIVLRVGEQICNGLFHHRDDGRSHGDFTCKDGRKALFEVRPNGFFILKSNPGGRIVPQYSLSGRGEIAGQSFTIEFNTVLPLPFSFR